MPGRLMGSAGTAAPALQKQILGGSRSAGSGRAMLRRCRVSVAGEDMGG